MFDVEIHSANEIRMGSPYKVCHLRFSGEWVPDLPETDWQDIVVWNENRSKVALVRWEVPQNIPGFRIIVVDPTNKSVKTSERFQGCCQSIAWTGPNRIAWMPFRTSKVPARSIESGPGLGGSGRHPEGMPELQPVVTHHRFVDNPPSVEVRPAAGVRVSRRHLSSHTSGVPMISNDPSEIRWWPKAATTVWIPSIPSGCLTPWTRGPEEPRNRGTEPPWHHCGRAACAPIRDPRNRRTEPQLTSETHTRLSGTAAGQPTRDCPARRRRGRRHTRGRRPSAS